MGGEGVGRRYATQQINDAYVVLLAAQFQQFCRDLHTEAASALAAAAQPAAVGQILQLNLTANRQLDKANAQPSSIGSDFAKLGLRIWNTLDSQDKRNITRQTRLKQLNVWRNAVAHQDFALEPNDQQVVGTTQRALRWVRTWRSACEALAVQMDRAVYTYIREKVGVVPW